MNTKSQNQGFGRWEDVLVLFEHKSLLTLMDEAYEVDIRGQSGTFIKS